MARDVHVCETRPRASLQHLKVVVPTSIKCDPVELARGIASRPLTGRLHEACLPKGLRSAAP